jgi:nicotinamidase-related amidase
MTNYALRLRTRPPSAIAAAQAHIVRTDWDPAVAAVIICDMWDSHHCVSAARRVASLAPRVDAVAAGLREDGALIIHAPSGCMEYYRDWPQRRRATEVPGVAAPVAIEWNGWDQESTVNVPSSLIDPGPCSCSGDTPCGSGGPPFPWTRETPLIDIAPNDAVSDDGQEVLHLLEERGILDVLVIGVHTNVCVLGRPFGIRQLVRLGKRPILCRDLTDSFHRDPRGHTWGTDQTVQHIEERWCPSVTSDQLIGGEPFVFADDEL